MALAQVPGKISHAISRVGFASPLFIFVAGVASFTGLLQVMIWVDGMSQMGGPEAHVRLNTDFLHMLTGATILRDGNGVDLYNLDVQRVAQNRVLAPFGQLGYDRLLPYNHPPLEALVLLPFMALPYSAVYAFWCLAAVIATLLALRLMLIEFAVQRSTALLLVVLTVSYHPFHRTLWLGQNSLFVLAALTSTYVFLRRSRDYAAGLFLLPVALMKPQILPAILLLILVQWRWRALASFSLGAVGFTVAAIPFLGVLWPLSYLRLLTVVATWQQNNIIDPTTMHNWRGFITNSIGVFAPGNVGLFATALSSVTFGVLLYSWWHVRDNAPKISVTQRKGLRKEDFVWGLGCITAVVTAIHLLPHDLSLLLLPAWIVGIHLGGGALSKRAANLWLLLIGGNYLLTLLLYFLPGQVHGIVLLDVVIMAAAGGWFVWHCRTDIESPFSANSLTTQ